MEKPYPETFYQDKAVPSLLDVFKKGDSFEDVQKADGSYKFFFIHTWFAVPFTSSFHFGRTTLPVINQCEESPGLVMLSRSSTFGKYGFFGPVVFETFSIWKTRDDMANFYRSSKHGASMEYWKNQPIHPLLGARRMWLTKSQIPPVGDRKAASDFIAAVKSEAPEFEQIPPPRH